MISAFAFLQMCIRDRSDIFKAYDDRKMVSLFEDEEIKDAGPKRCV